METDLFQLWRLVAELLDQLSQNKAMMASLQAQAGSIRLATSHQGTGFALRRFNMHMSQEAYESELRRMNATLKQQNFVLQNDNKQLAILLREYDQTLETAMSKFRTDAYTSQQHELSLARHYESLLLSEETHRLSSDLFASSTYFHSLARISHLLRATLRACNGEPPEGIQNEARDITGPEGVGMDDWALEQESELARLEYENYELRRMVGVPPRLSPQSSPGVKKPLESVLDSNQRHNSLAMSSESSNVASGDGLSPRLQPLHTQIQTQISLDGPPVTRTARR